MEKHILEGLKSSVDYSEVFSEKIRSLAMEIGKMIEADIVIDSNMNYSAGQSIFLSSCTHLVVPEESSDIEWKIRLIISSRASYFTFLILKSTVKNQWTNVHFQSIPPSVMRFLKENVFPVFQNANLAQIDQKHLWQSINGFFTEMDGKPANVFEILFSEEY